MNPTTGLDRRELLRRGALLSAAAGSPALLSACATGGGNAQETQPEQKKKTSDDPENPFGVDPTAPLDVVIFKGGFSDEYAKYHESMYSKKYPKAKVKHTGTREIMATLQTRFVNGNPCDVVDNSGAQAMDSIALIEQNQMTEMSQLLEAPSWDDPKVKVKDTITEGSLDPATHKGKVWGIPYALNINGLWHDKALFEKNGWEMPKTWDGLMALGEKIKASGMPPWTYQGQYPGYMVTVFGAMVTKHGGNEIMRRIDNLEDGAWQQPEVKNVLDALYELKARGFIMKGTAGMSHTQAQNEWAKHKAAIIPCGSWLKSEIGSLLPADFQMAVTPTPSLDESDKMPYESAPFSSGEVFYVPAKAKNVPGGLEYLRLMLSKEGAQKFSELTYTLTISTIAHKEQQLDSVLESSLAVIDAAKAAPRIEQWKYASWYTRLRDFVEAKMGQLLTGKLDVKGFIETVQKEADKTKKDPKVIKQKR